MPAHDLPDADLFVPRDVSGSLGPHTVAMRTPAPHIPPPNAVHLGPRRALLTIRRVDPWSVLKLALMFSVCMLVIGVVAVAALYAALDQLEVFDSVNKFVKELTQSDPRGSGQPTGGIDVVFNPKAIIGGATILGVINVVILTALATLGAFLYNLCADIAGGIEVVIGERD
jgi:hypothetical protein